jgi:RNA polymerase sigma factor (sigma-70 family)
MSADNVADSAGPGPDDLLARLVKAAADGDAGAWGQLVDRFASLLWSVCRKYRLTEEDAADVVQLTWLRLLEHLDRIRDPQRLAGWLATTCRHECQALLRKSRSSLSVEPEQMDRLADDGSLVDEPLLTAEEHAALWQAFQLLSDWCQRVLRELIVDAEDGPPSYRLAAARLQSPPGSLGPTRARCLTQLRKLLDKGGI